LKISKYKEGNMSKKYRPITPSQRMLVLQDRQVLTKKKKREKGLTLAKTRTCGRNHSGHITCRHRGGGHKKLFRVIDFRRDKEKIEAKVASIEYDPNRTSYIALLHYLDGEKRYILAPQGLQVGDRVLSGEGAPYKVGCSMKMKEMPIGAVIHNIELYPGRGGKLVRSAGLGAQLMARSEGYATVRFPSGEVRTIPEECRATFGVLSNAERNLRVEGKAGRSRWKGIRPTVRGIAMNPVDHPMGGGEGRGKGNHPQSPWGMCAKGYRTRSKKKSNKRIVQGRSR
jgi:large subunit ribosomal protein L2